MRNGPGNDCGGGFWRCCGGCDFFHSFIRNVRDVHVVNVREKKIVGVGVVVVVLETGSY